MSSTSIIVAGEPVPCGAYLLRIRLRSACDVVFGRFNAGKAVQFPPGDYVYVGSAMGRTGSATLSNRLLRHARRSGAALSHPIYADLVREFKVLGWLQDDKCVSLTKTLRWHVDYLLDRAEAELIQVFLFRSTERQEEALARYLAADPATAAIVPGLGASDDRGNTHLLAVTGDHAWWHSLHARYEQFDDLPAIEDGS